MSRLGDADSGGDLGKRDLGRRDLGRRDLGGMSRLGDEESSRVDCSLATRDETSDDINYI